MGDKTVRALWQDYRFLTKEMLKFLSKQDMSLFYELLNQRGRMQAIIEQTPDDGFTFSAEGQSILSEVQLDNQNITRQLQIRRNSIKRSHQVSEIYNNRVGARLGSRDWNI